MAGQPLPLPTYIEWLAVDFAPDRKFGGRLSKQRERSTLEGMINYYLGGSEASISVVISLWSSLHTDFGLGTITCFDQ